MNSAGMKCVVLSLAVMLAGCHVEQVKREDEISRFRGYMQDQKVKLDPQVTKPLTMRECEQIALVNSLSLQVQRMTLKISDDAIRLAMTGALPHARAAYTNTVRSNDNLMNQGGSNIKAGETHEQNAGIAATIPILDWGITYYSWQIAKDAKKQNELAIMRSAQLLVRDVRIAYVRHSSAQRREKLLQKALVASKEVMRVAISLEKAGETVHADTALVSATVAQAELDLAVVQKQINDTKIDLSQLMSLPPGVDFKIVMTDVKIPELPTAEEVQQLEERALLVRPELVVQDLQRHISAYEVKQKAAAFFPRVDGVGGFNWTNNSQMVNSNWFYGGVAVSYGLLDGGADIYRYTIAKKAVDIEIARTLLLSLGVIYDVQMRALRVKESNEVVKAAAALEEARQAALDRVVSLYKMGLQDEAGAARALADLTMQATLMDTAQREYLIAWIELETAALPEISRFAVPATQPSTQPATAPANTQLQEKGK